MRSILQASAWPSPSHRQSCRSWPQVRKRFWKGCVQSPQSSSVWPCSRAWAVTSGPPQQFFPPSSSERLAPNLDYRGEALGQISSQQCILRGSHQQLRTQPLSNGPHSSKVFRNLQDGGTSEESTDHSSFPSLPPTQPSPHLSLLEGHQPGPPLYQPAVPPTTTQHSPVPPETQGEDGTFMSMGLGHNPVGLCWQSPGWVMLLGCREVGNRSSLGHHNRVVTPSC